MRLTADRRTSRICIFSGCREQPGKRVGGVPYLGTGSLLHCNTGAWFLQWFCKNILCFFVATAGQATGRAISRLRFDFLDLSYACGRSESAPTEYVHSRIPGVRRNITLLYAVLFCAVFVRLCRCGDEFPLVLAKGQGASLCFGHVHGQ